MSSFLRRIRIRDRTETEDMAQERARLMTLENVAQRQPALTSFPAVEKHPSRRDELQQDIVVADIRRQHY
jgi:hypothetical protein